MFECVEPAMLPVRPRAEGSEQPSLIDPCKPDTAFGDGGAERGVKGRPDYPIVVLPFADVGFELRKLPEDVA